MALPVESAILGDAVKMIVKDIDAGGPAAAGAAGAAGEGAGGPGASPDDGRRSSISAAIDSVKSWFGGAGDPRNRGANAGLLKPSLKGTRAMKQARRETDGMADL